MNRYRLKKSERGQSLVEFALIFPILILLIVAVVDFGWIFFAKLTTNNASREVARLYAVHEELDTSEALTLASGKMPNIFVSGTMQAVVAKTGTPLEAVATVRGEVRPLVGLFFDNNVPVESKSYMKIEYKITSTPTPTP